MTNFLNDPITKIAADLRANKYSIKDLVSEAYSNIEKHQPQLNALISIRDKKDALKAAHKKQSSLSKSPALLHGIPYVLKDSYVTTKLPTTAASSILKNFMSPYDATVHKKLKSSGAILIGKANMDSWGHGASSENTDFDPVKNPYKLTRSAGGSSGGVAAAIASKMCAFGIGEDTGGSIRNPAAWTNTTGLKVTYGRVSRYGCISYASSFDTVGPMAKTALDCAVVLQSISGVDKYDATSSPKQPDDYIKNITKTNKQLAIGIPKQVKSEGLDNQVSIIFDQAAKQLELLGHKVVSISMPTLPFGLAVYYLIAPSETSSNLSRYDGVRYGGHRKHFTKETMRRIMTGTFALSTGYYDAYYKKAQKGRTLLINEYRKAFDKVDVIIMPTTPTPPPKLGELISNPLSNMLADVFTATQNPVGVPSLAIPAGFTPDNLPVGIQIIAPLFQESLILALGHQFQQHTNWHTKKPTL